MPEDLMRYDQLAQNALKGVVREALRKVEKSGLPGEHHFYIAFNTRYPGVNIGERMLERYPREMTVVRIAGQIALRREAMGFGDVILMAMVGSFVGWQPVVVTIFVAAFLALAAMLVTRVFAFNREIPFGPYLSLGTLVTLLSWKWIWPVVAFYFSLGPALVLIGFAMTVMLIVLLRLIRLIKGLLGFGDFSDVPMFDEWTSADQLTHFDGENVDRQQGRWRTEIWPGETTARGQSQWQQWQRPNADGWRQNWTRRN